MKLTMELGNKAGKISVDYTENLMRLCVECDNDRVDVMLNDVQWRILGEMMDGVRSAQYASRKESHQDACREVQF